MPAFFTNIPHRLLYKPARLIVSCPNFVTIDTTLHLEKKITIGLRRDPHVYGAVRFRLWNVTEEKTYPGAKVDIEGHKVVADDNGYITLTLPFVEQKQRYKITCSNPEIDDFITMPCGPDDVILVK